ncbi:MAG TPA: proline--tRNA ligase, partial [Parachlamydiales bacterium]|nr:proline--tRNA ligase [Parachlamydiales bacterium]
IEAMMQDRKALQAGTSHFLGQNFATSCDIQFRNPEGELEYGWTTSWGVTTRLIGGLIMTHSDDDGLVLPPKIASAQLVIIPIVHQEESKSSVYSYCEQLASDLRKIHYAGQALRVIVDKRDMRGGEKSWSWIKKGVPLRLEVGPRDIESGQFGLLRRDKPHRESTQLTASEIVSRITEILDDMQNNLLSKATAFRNQHTVKIDRKADFYDFFTPKKEDEVHGGFALCHWNGDPAVEEKVKEDLNVTIRCIPLDAPDEPGLCVITGEPSARRVIFAKSY